MTRQKMFPLMLGAAQAAYRRVWMVAGFLLMIFAIGLVMHATPAVQAMASVPHVIQGVGEPATASDDDDIEDTLGDDDPDDESSVDDDSSDDDGGDDGGDDGISDDDDEWEGLIQTRPSETLTGTWTILLGDGVTLTVQADAATRFDPPTSAAYAVGGYVEVDGVRQPDQSVLAERLRAEDFEDGEVVVRFAPNTIPDVLVDKYDLTLKSALLESANIYLYTTDDDESEEIAQLAAEPNVIWAELNYISSVPEKDGYKTWGWGGKEEPGDYSGQPAYFQVGYGSEARQVTGAGVTVAIMDTGIYTPHEQFAGHLLLPSLDVISDDTDPSEVGPGLGWGHGTHIAGIIAHMAPEATILPIRVLDQNGRGNTFLLAYAIEWAVDHGAQVINLSLGTDANSLVLQDVVARAVEQDVVIVAAVGNSNASTVQYPAGYDGVIGVTAVDGDNRKADFANYGAEWVDLAAPGVGIMSTIIAGEGAGYASWSGTSMSTAFVTGAAALLLSQPATHAVAQGQISVSAVSPSISPVVDLLATRGDNIDAMNPAYAGQLGRLLNVSRALGIDAPDVQTLWVPLVAR